VLEREVAKGSSSDLTGIPWHQDENQLRQLSLSQEQLEFRASYGVFADHDVVRHLESAILESVVVFGPEKKPTGRPKAGAPAPARSSPRSDSVRLPHDKYYAESMPPRIDYHHLTPDYQRLTPTQVSTRGKSTVAVFTLGNPLLVPMKGLILMRHGIDQPVATAEFRIDGRQKTDVRVEMNNLSRDDIAALKRGEFATMALILECP
jgi:hypothetical protein